MSSLPDFLYSLLVWGIPGIFAITLHEVSHGWVASLLGDNTAKSRGRLSVNPLTHVDPVGTVVVPFLTIFMTGYGFGWAKPVPVEPRYFKSPMVDMALVAAAGPIANFFMACFWATMIVFAGALLDPSSTQSFLVDMGSKGILINIVLLVINLLPIPPLDGGRVVAGVLPPSLATQFMKLERFGMVIIIVLMVSGILGKILWPTVLHFVKIIGMMFGLNG